MGAAQAEAFWRDHLNFDMILVTDKNEVVLTEGIAGLFTLGDGRDETIRVLKA